MAPAAAAYLHAAIIAAGFAFFLAQVPVQVSDCVNKIAAAFTNSWQGLLLSELDARAFFRPLLNAPTKLVLDLARGHEGAAFRVVQIAQVFAAFGLLVRVLRVRAWPETIGALVAIVVLGGSHAFGTLIREGYPINTYFTVAICALVALNIVTEPRPRWWTDGLVVASFIVAVGTIETGLLVWVTAVCGAMAGCKGVSRPTLVGLTLLVAAYFVARFLILDIGTPDLLERSSGFGLQRLEPAELVARFGDNPLPFYAYNVTSSIGTVLFSEPRDGVFRLGRAVVEDAVRPWMIVHVVSSAAAMTLIAWFAWAAKWRRPRAEWSRGQQLVFVAGGVLVANAVIGYAYTKDQIMSVAAIFMAAAVAAPVTLFVSQPPHRRWLRIAAAVLVMVAASLWSLRVIGLQHLLVHTAFTTRNDWAAVDAAAVAQPFGGNGDLIALIQSLRTAALTRRAAYPDMLSSPFAEDWFGH